MQVRGTRVFKILSFNRSGNYPRKVNQPPPQKKPNKQKKKTQTKQNKTQQLTICFIIIAWC